MYEPTEIKHQGSGMAISKNSSRVLNSESIFSPPTITLKLKLKTDNNYVHGYQTHIIWVHNALNKERYNGFDV
jgi:hypothetical protein